MAGEWETLQLRAACLKIGSGATPRGGKEAYKGGVTSLIRSQNIYNDGFHRDGLVYIDDEQSAELRNVEVKPDDVLLNITGDSVARCCQVAADVLPARVNQHVAIIRPQPESLDARFLRYVLVSHEYQQRLLALASAGATRPALTKTMIEELDIPSPPLAEQKAIAAVLGALDDKIELNRRMNATLEAMARALFQSWFVDFDPVRQNMDAKPQARENPIPEAANLPDGEAGGVWFTYAIECEGGSLYIGQTDNLRRRWKQHVDGKGAEWTKTHPPVALVYWEKHDSLEAAVTREAKLKSGSGREWLKREVSAGRQAPNLDPLSARQAGATAALFPASFQDSELGHIPKGWEVCPLSDKIELLSGGTPKTSEPDYWDGDIPWYSVKDAPAESDVWVIQTEKHVTKLGIENSAAQILPEGTTIISARGTVGKLALVGTPMAMNQSCYGVRGVKGYADYFTYFALQRATAELQQRTHGTVFDTITRQTFETLDCIFPPAALTRAFDKTVAPLVAQLRANLHQSRTLATLRDTLLPKLLSGELSVAEFTARMPAKI
jgi:restriction endonuclease S subunit/predicted GIY-YIG superfamily endonuclease